MHDCEETIIHSDVSASHKIFSEQIWKVGRSRDISPIYWTNEDHPKYFSNQFFTADIVETLIVSLGKLLGSVFAVELPRDGIIGSNCLLFERHDVDEPLLCLKWWSACTRTSWRRGKMLERVVILSGDVARSLYIRG